MTNKEAMCHLTDEQFFAKIEWLLHDYGRNYIDTRIAVIEWLGKEAKQENLLNKQGVKKPTATYCPNCGAYVEVNVK